jgi:hypothetical protein
MRTNMILGIVVLSLVLVGGSVLSAQADCNLGCLPHISLPTCFSCLHISLPTCFSCAAARDMDRAKNIDPSADFQTYGLQGDWAGAQ